MYIALCRQRKYPMIQSRRPCTICVYLSFPALHITQHFLSSIFHLKYISLKGFPSLWKKQNKAKPNNTKTEFLSLIKCCAWFFFSLNSTSLLSLVSSFVITLRNVYISVNTEIELAGDLLVTYFYPYFIFILNKMACVHTWAVH